MLLAAGANNMLLAAGAPNVPSRARAGNRLATQHRRAARRARRHNPYITMQIFQIDILEPLRTCPRTRFSRWGWEEWREFCLKCLCIFLPLFLLAIPMLPYVSQFETKFINVHNVTIINNGDQTYQNVTLIKWGILTACYHSDLFPHDKCINSEIVNPYAFTVSENNNQIHATVQRTWINTMFIHVVCFIFAVTTWITVITAVTVHPIGWEICSERMCCVGMIYLQVLVVGLMASTVVTVLADFYIFKIVANRMESFAKGGSSKVDTKATYYVWTVTGCVYIFLICLLTSIGLMRDIYTMDHHLTKVDDFREKAANIQKEMKALQGSRDDATRGQFVHYAVNNNWVGIED